MTTYQPNFKDPRTYKRAKKALGFVRGCISDHKPQSWSTRYIDKHLGQQNNQLGKWLRNHLIIITDERYSKERHVSKQVILNAKGFRYVKDMLAGIKFQTFNEWNASEALKSNGQVSSLKQYDIYPCVLQVGDYPLVKDWVMQEFNQELKTLTFEYQDKSSRLWHPLQRIKRDYKKAIFSDLNLKYQYDIECAALTLLHQYSQNIPEVIYKNELIQRPMDLYLPAIRQYLDDRTLIRKQIAHDADIPEQVVKVIINALIAGAHLGKNPQCAIFKLLQGDIARIEYLQQHPFIVEFRSNIKTMWDYIKPTLQKRTIELKSGVIRTCPISSKQKWNLYFKLERQVLDQVRGYLDRTNNKYFLEHDGWSARHQIDEESLITYVYNKTGFKISVDVASLTTTTIYPCVLQVGENQIRNQYVG